MAIQAHITPEEAELVINAVMVSPQGQQQDFVHKLQALSVEEGAEMCRTVAADVKAHRERKQAASDEVAA